MTVASEACITIISSFLELGREKTVDAAKICGSAENVVKTETQQTFVNGLLGFITLNVILRWKRVYLLTIIALGYLSIWAAHLHCSLIYFWVPSSCFA